MAYSNTAVRPGTLVPGSKEANIERVALESFSIRGTVLAGTKFGVCWGTPWAIVPVHNLAGHTFRVLVFQDQAPEIWALSQCKTGDKIAMVVHPYNTSKSFPNTYKVCQTAPYFVPNTGALGLLEGKATPTTALEPNAAARAFLESGSQNWKEYKNDLYKYLPI